MSSVVTIRSRNAAVWITSSESRVHGVWASSSTPAPNARSTWPDPWACAVTGRSAACAASQIADSSPSVGVGPASAFNDTLIAAAPSRASSSTAAVASSADVSSRPVPAGAQESRVG